MKSIIVKKTRKDDLVSFILYTFPSLPKASIYKALRNKDIKINGKRINSNIKINENDKIDIYISDEILFNLPKQVDICYEDDNILVCVKPQGILSNNENINSDEVIFEPTFEDIIQKEYKTAKICHRLDRNTMGLLIFAKNDISYKELLNGFKNSNITKEYIAYVSNYKFNEKHEKLEKYIYTDKETGYSKIFDSKGSNLKKISTEYFVLKTNKEQNYAILRIVIHTGKTHQIRVQMKNILHPIIGDPKYGSNEINKNFNIYKQLLFAYKYSFNFENVSPLSYLNKKSIVLDERYYINKLGCDFNEKRSIE